MNPLLDIATVKAALADQLREVEGFGHRAVMTKPGGAPAWARDHRMTPKPYAEVHAAGWDGSEPGVGAQLFEYYDLEIRAWLPFSFENPSTTETWDALLSRIQTRLIEHRSLGGQVRNIAVPSGRNGWETFSYAQQPEVLCHFALITLRADRFVRYETS